MLYGRPLSLKLIVSYVSRLPGIISLNDILL